MTGAQGGNEDEDDAPHEAHGAEDARGGGAPPSAPIVPGSVHRVVVASRDGRARGVAAIGRRALRVPNALPGETLDVRLVHVGRHVAVGRIASVVDASRSRVRDACPHGDVCPGCGLRTSSGADRLAFKRARLVDALAAVGLGDVPVADPVAAPAEDRWRHKAYVTPRRTRKGIVVGMFEESTHRLAPIAGCLAHAEPVERAVEAVRRALTMADPSVYDERSRLGWLRHVSVRSSLATGETVVVLVVRDGDGGSAPGLAREITKHAPHVTGVALNIHPDPGNAPYGPAFETVLGTTSIEEASGTDLFTVSAGSFFQVNPAAATGLVDRIEAEAASAPPGWALDLYGGVGTTAARLARTRERVLLVESPGPAAEDAKKNLDRIAGARAEVRAARVEELVASALAGLPSVVVANPPRGGLSETVRQALAEAPPPLLIYVACSPESLARDSAALAASGLRLVSVQPFDLMPQTPQVEAVAVLRRPG